MNAPPSYRGLRWQDLVPGRLHLLVLRAFVGPFLASFTVILFILSLQILSVHKDRIFGKGFGFEVIAQLLGYLAFVPVLEALALSMLMASLIALGGLGERYELAAIKSAGISLFRLLVPLGIIASVVTTIAFGFSFYIKPTVNLKFFSLLWDTRQAQPAFALTPGVFSNVADGYSIRATERRADGLLVDMVIYDHTEERGNVSVILADSGRMRMDDRTLYLRLQLYHGVMYEEPKPDPQRPYALPFARTRFDTLNTQLDLSGLQLKRTDENQFRSHQYMLDIGELGTAIDSLDRKPKFLARELEDFFEQQLKIKERMARIRQSDSVRATGYDTGCGEPLPVLDSLRQLSSIDRQTVYSTALNAARTVESQLTFAETRRYSADRDIRGYDYERQTRYSFPVACLLFMFIGAPLGAIIRKGGLGLPLLLGIGFFVVFYLLVSYGKKFAREGVTSVWFGAWLPILVMVPLAAFLSYQSATDSALFDLTAWRNLLAEQRIRLLASVRSLLGQRDPVA